MIRRPVLVVLLLLAACGASAREKALRGSLLALNAARDGFVAWDRQRQQAIVDEAESHAEGKAALLEYRRKRTAVVQALATAYSVLAAAALDSKTPVADVLKAIADFRAAVVLLRGGPP